MALPKSAILMDILSLVTAPAPAAQLLLADLISDELLMLVIVDLLPRSKMEKFLGLMAFDTDLRRALSKSTSLKKMSDDVVADESGFDERIGESYLPRMEFFSLL